MMDSTTFNYLNPNPEQVDRMLVCRNAAKAYYDVLEETVPDGTDKAHLLRKLREVAMWANVAITRNADGSPR